MREAAPAAERIFRWGALLATALALLLLFAYPATLLPGGSPARLKAIVHLLTVGGLLGAYYPLQAVLWRRLYGPAPGREVTALALAGIHWGGLALLAWGFFADDPWLAYLGGHYLVPTGVVASVGQGVVAAWRRPAGAPRHLAAHLPGAGLVVTLSLGALLVMDAHTGRYGIYSPHTILVHLLSGAFLFVLPVALLHHAVEQADAAAPGTGLTGANAPFSATATVLLPCAVAALGVLGVALSGAGSAPPAALALGLALLGAVALWIGLPALGLGQALTLAGVGRFLWGAVGLLLLFAAIRAWRGMTPVEADSLLRAGVTIFLFTVALPETLLRFVPARGGSTPAAPVPPETARAVLLLVWLLAAGLLLVAQLAGVAIVVRLASTVLLVALAWQLKALATRPG